MTVLAVTNVIPAVLNLALGQNSCVLTYIHTLIFSHFKVTLRPLAGLDQGLDLGMFHNPRVDHMISRKPKSIVTKDTWLPQLVIPLFHAL